MSTKQFVHLHLHSSYSLLDGACRVKDVVSTAAANNMPAVAVTDHGVMYGIIDFYKTARDAGVKPILGCEVYVTQGNLSDRKTEGTRVPVNHLVLLAKNEAGYQNLCRLVTTAHLEGFYYKPRIDKQLLAKHHDGLIGLSACLQGEVAGCLLKDDMNAAVHVSNEYIDMLGKGNFFFEVQDHGIPEQRKVNQLLKQLSATTGIPLVATNDVHYIAKKHASAHEVLLCLQTQTVMSDQNRMRLPTEEFYMKTREEMEPLFKEFPGSIDRTLEIAEMCNVELTFGKLHFPTFVVPKGINQKNYLIKLGKEGLEHKYGLKNFDHPTNDFEKEIVQRFNYELSIIEKTGYINYYLVVWDFVHFAKSSDIPVGPGRGSGGGSLLAYSLGITSIDPIKYGLIFERFLNPERISPPDFDIDFCQARREEVIEYVKDKYGRENVAQIITFGSLGAKTVIRDVGRVLEIPYSDCDKLSKMVPEDPDMDLRKALEINPEFKKSYQSNADCKRILDYGFVLEGLYRNQGTHAAGVVIGEKPLVEIIPLSRDKEKQTVTQYSMEPLGEIGLLKMDFLGLKTLTVIKESVDLVKETAGNYIDVENLPMDDKPTYELFNRGDTVGVFQLESPGMRDLIRRVGIDRIEDLIAMIALYRPGPMNMLDDYVNRKTGKSKIEYDHPLLESVLKETYGVMLYQEEVQKAANVLAGYSLGQADILRKAMGKKKPEVMEEQREKFISGCAKTIKLNSKQAGKIFDTMAKFAGYGFNKAHSAGYAIISYQTAYLKANYPAEFMSALLSSEIGNADKLPVFANEALEMDLKILPPDINESSVRFKPLKQAIRFGLAGIKNVGEGASEAIVAECRKNGRFTGMVNFCSRIDGQAVNKKVIESLVRSGAFDSIDTNRAKLFSAIDFAMSRAAQAARDKRSGQGNLFEMLGTDTPAALDENLPECPNWHESELLANEKDLLGIYLSGHPLTKFASLLDRYQLTTVHKLKDLEDRTPTRLGGIISQLEKKLSKDKRPWARIVIEDLDGSMEVLVFPETYEKYQARIIKDSAIMVCGDVSKREEPPKLVAQEIYPLAEIPRHFATKLSIHLPVSTTEQQKMEKLKNMLRLHPGLTPVVICMEHATGQKVFVETASSLRVFPGEELIHKLEQEFGEKSVYVAVNPSPYLTAKRKKWGEN
ncbi:MAG: DNA polymerase III subunit alpha [Lentisphaerae bacterium RIFOXYA12_FULL_48_11]|nr:MAG: DNA polymerase III subunit alpha [Lentisphaerae bacterium RIFOXYA12_FULL_48_11]